MTSLTTRILDLAKRVDLNVPRHSDPEQFHAEKSEISRALEDIAAEIGPINSSGGERAPAHGGRI